MQTSYQLYMPTKVISKIGASEEVGEILLAHGYKTILLVTDKGIVNSGLLENIVQSLNNGNIEYKIFSDVEPNPKSATITKIIDQYKDFNIDAVLAIGGGSSIDTAKAVAVMLKNEGNILDYEGVEKIPNEGVPLVAIPTTAGTGSEVTASTIITDENSLFKVAVISSKIFPKLAILDAQLTLNCPRHITSSTGMDALTHAIESYLSKQKNPVSNAIALHAIKLIEENINRAYYYGSDIHSREKMLEASMLAGYAFSQTRLGNVHAISQAFGGLFDIPHGVANATILPYIMEYNLPAAVDEYVEISKALNVYDPHLSAKENAEKVVKKIKEMNKELEIPMYTKELGVNLDHIDQIIKDSMRSGNILVNPRLTTAKDIEYLVRLSYDGEVPIPLPASKNNAVKTGSLAFN
ncbi:alcohol dehydrogenase [Lysinibacillus composti]|uniref:Iron-containing alcohol dehydrogenase n=1 Tax=Lysinibacillus composti TaxID=720633 RepID=A0A3N9U9Y4_9BACI|nr:iron-containing alcohol dehydrogenase [Lysinibacillus composti]MBM7610060.1 alcohol dehydrogenase [Lysinibacillus composti]RQW73317.1 iron-containing alcohol dehydrogenase [Lysinibacillus composti]